MTDKTPTVAEQLAEAQQVVQNLQSACNELEQQLNYMRGRCANMAVERDNVVRIAKQYEAEIQRLQGTESGTESGIEEVPFKPAPAKKRKAEAVN